MLDSLPTVARLMSAPVAPTFAMFQSVPEVIAMPERVSARLTAVPAPGVMVTLAESSALAVDSSAKLFLAVVWILETWMPKADPFLIWVQLAQALGRLRLSAQPRNR